VRSYRLAQPAAPATESVEHALFFPFQRAGTIDDVVPAGSTLIVVGAYTIEDCKAVYDDPDVTPADKVRYNAAVVVHRGVQPEGEFGVTEIPGGKYAVFTHPGPCESLGRSYQRFFGGWLPKSGRELRDAEAFEECLLTGLSFLIFRCGEAL
jgi:hypothetical protein